MNPDEHTEALKREGIAVSVRDFLNKTVKVKWVLPPFLILGVLISLALQQVSNINARNDREAAIKVYEQCVLSHNAGLANKALQQSIVDASRSQAALVQGFLIIFAGPLESSSDPAVHEAALKLDELNAQIDESQEKVDAIKVRECDGLKPDGYEPSEVG